MKLCTAIFVLFFSGCATTTINGDMFAEATESLKKDGVAVLPKGKIVKTEDKPRIIISTHIDCSVGEVLLSECDDQLDLEWSRVSRLENRLVMDVPTSIFTNASRHVSLPISEIDEVDVFYDDRDADWRPVWGVGVMIFGPSAFFAFHFHVFPFEWWAFDVGIFGAPHVGSGFVGTRLRPFNFDGWMPFVGIAANGILTGGSHAEPIEGEVEPETDTAPVTRIGPRLGVDLEFSKRRGLIGLELNMFYTQGPEDGFVLNKIDAWSPYAGAYAAYLF